MLLTCFLALLSLWRPVFRQERSYRRALRQALGSLTVLGTATLTRILASLGLTSVLSSLFREDAGVAEIVVNDLELDRVPQTTPGT